MSQITEIIQTIGSVGLACIFGVGICAVSGGYLLIFRVGDWRRHE